MTAFTTGDREYAAYLSEKVFHLNINPMLSLIDLLVSVLVCVSLRRRRLMCGAAIVLSFYVGGD